MKEEILEKIIERAAKIWQVDPSELNEDTTFAEMNAKSTHISQLTTYLEDEYDVEIPYMNFKRCKTLGEAAEFVAEAMDE